VPVSRTPVEEQRTVSTSDPIPQSFDPQRWAGVESTTTAVRGSTEEARFSGR
jgi:hypothetical protein